jgi:hypothetical protein
MGIALANCHLAMAAMKTIPTNSRWALALIGLLVLAGGCSRHTTLDIPKKQVASGQLPFDHLPRTSGHSPTAGMPRIVLPSGTWIRVHLRSPLSSATARAGDAVDAILDEALVVQQQTLALAGARVTGRILMAKAAGADPGYLRITLTSILLDGRLRELKTSSLFLKGAQAAAPDTGITQASLATPTIGLPGDVQFTPQRQLSFRLTENLDLPD